ncbi:MAG: hypothetical protein L6R42_008737 [Xanthoria sp. 1 TBL-2021]|nr:MAG: hypothetical protein L6R42_008737 [Xanthoria sp. 1 TBL-2021]
MDASETLETQRQQNIQRNQEHLRKLGIYQKHDIVRHERKPPAPKRRKIKISPPPPSRVSARIASATVIPTYNEEDKIEDKARVKQHKDSRPTSSKPPRKSTESTAPPTNTSLPSTSVESLRHGWTSWTPTADAPSRDETSTFHFDSHPDFTPNKSPEEMLREGCFGGSYFRPLYSKRLGITISDDYLELPSAWIAGLDVDRYLISPTYDPEVNKFKVSCGQSIEEWEAAGWIDHTYDVRGWFQWYCRFFMGRRCEDDGRQVGRWKRCVGETGRWRRMLIKKYISMGIREVFDDGEEEEQVEVSPVMHQTCFHWALEIRQDILDRYWKSVG